MGIYLGLRSEKLMGSTKAMRSLMGSPMVRLTIQNLGTVKEKLRGSLRQKEKSMVIWTGSVRARVMEIGLSMGRLRH